MMYTRPLTAGVEHEERKSKVHLTTTAPKQAPADAFEGEKYNGSYF